MSGTVTRHAVHPQAAGTANESVARVLREVLGRDMFRILKAIAARWGRSVQR